MARRPVLRGLTTIGVLTDVKRKSYSHCGYVILCVQIAVDRTDIPIAVEYGSGSVGTQNRSAKNGDEEKDIVEQ